MMQQQVNVISHMTRQCIHITNKTEGNSFTFNVKNKSFFLRSLKKSKLETKVAGYLLESSRDLYLRVAEIST